MRQTLPPFNAMKQHRSPDEIYGLFNRIFFIWINPILIRGYNNILTDQDAPCLSQNMKPELTRKAMLQIWSQRAKPETKKSLPIALIKCLKTPCLAAIMSRLLLISFRYSQPTLINESIRYIVTYPKREESNYGFWLIVSAFTVYVGLALSTAVHQHFINRLKLMTRNALVGLIHEKTMKSPSFSYDNGNATSLISNDTESLDAIAEMIHET